MVKTSVSVFWRVFTAVIAIVLVTGGWHSCSVNSQIEAPSSSQLQELPADEPDGIPRARAATCVYPYAGLRKEPGIQEKTKDGEKNYIIPIVYGERVEMLGESVENEKEKRTYIKVRLKDGQEGWVHQYLFESHAILAAVTTESELYRRPDLMTLREDKLEVGEIIVVIEDSMSLSYKEDWLHVSNREKKKKGWIRRANVLSFSQTDVQLALRYYIAKQSKEPDVKQTRLEEIIADESFQESQLLDLIQSELNKLSDKPVGPRKQSSIATERGPKEERLFITEDSAPIYRNPASTTEDMITELKEGDECLVLEVGDRMVIGGKNDFWYRVQHEDSEGWIHGFYTSLRSME